VSRGRARPTSARPKPATTSCASPPPSSRSRSRSPVTCRWCSTSARDTDFTGKLVDVEPDGRATYLTDGILRARYRNSLSEPEQVYEVTLDLEVTSNVFLPGHRIRLEISSSNFPRYDRNTNTGGVIAQESLDQAIVATNRVLHGPEHPSRLVLPNIRR
jgi:putative CocE/NonD family hydrolase